MARLLQGDVGTGKTVVALIAAIHIVITSQKDNSSNVDKGDALSRNTEQDFSHTRNDRSIQVAIMAPTEILARQHFAGNEAWLMQW